MTKQSKTRKVAVFPDGSRYPIHREGGMWRWSPRDASSHLSGAKQRLELEYGGHIETEPNPNYREPSVFERLSTRMEGR